MNISEGLLSYFWLFACGVVYVPVLAMALWRAPWGALRENRNLQHMLYGATAFLMVLWSMRAGISPGLGIHFLGLTVMTLVFGWDLTIIAASAVLVGMSLIGKDSWEAIFVNGLCSVLIPVTVTYFIARYVDRKMPKNFFIFLFVGGFFAAGISTAVAGLSISAILVIDGVYDFQKIMLEYIRYLPLVMFPEGLLNGIFLTGMLVFHPDWVRMFDADIYLDKQ